MLFNSWKWMVYEDKLLSLQLSLQQLCRFYSKHFKKETKYSFRNTVLG